MYPILFSFGKIHIYAYGLMVALGIITAMFLIEREAANSGLAKEKVIDLVFWIIVWGLVGARLAYICLYPRIYLHSPLDILKLYEGGLVFYGGLIFGTIAALISFRRKKLPIWETLDILMLYLPLAHAFGRIGCFLNGCCSGKPTCLPWGVVFPGEAEMVHPTQLYSAFLLLMIFFSLNLIRRKQIFPGQIFSAYLIFYGLARFFVEFFRTNPVIALGLSVYQYFSLLLIVLGFYFYFFLKKASKLKKASA
jgi:phosphatidylglycerol---prolipoprotein diacylglyceryl transferase